MTRRRISVVAMASALALTSALWNAAPAKAAGEFPGGRTMTFVSWSAAGSPKDIMARQVAKTLKQQKGWNIQVIDVTGGGGAAAFHYLLSQPANGLTLVAAAGSMDVALQTSLKHLFKPDQFRYVAQIQTDPFVLAVNSDSPIHTMAALVSAGKGHALNVSGFGADSEEHLVAAALAEQGHFGINWIPYSGGSKAIAAVLGGNADAVLTNLSAVVPLVQSGKLRVLGVTTAAPVTGLAAPTFASLGYKRMVRALWRGFIVRAGTPETAIQTIAAALKDLPTDPNYVKYVTAVHIGVQYLDPSAFATSVTAEMAQEKGELHLLGAK